MLWCDDVINSFAMSRNISAAGLERCFQQLDGTCLNRLVCGLLFFNFSLSSLCSMPVHCISHCMITILPMVATLLFTVHLRNVDLCIFGSQLWWINTHCCCHCCNVMQALSVLNLLFVVLRWCYFPGKPKIICQQRTKNKKKQHHFFEATASALACFIEKGHHGIRKLFLHGQCFFLNFELLLPQSELTAPSRFQT